MKHDTALAILAVGGILAAAYLLSKRGEAESTKLILLPELAPRPVEPVPKSPGVPREEEVMKLLDQAMKKANMAWEQGTTQLKKLVVSAAETTAETYAKGTELMKKLVGGALKDAAGWVSDVAKSVASAAMNLEKKLLSPLTKPFKETPFKTVRRRPRPSLIPKPIPRSKAVPTPVPIKKTRTLPSRPSLLPSPKPRVSPQPVRPIPKPRTIIHRPQPKPKITPIPTKPINILAWRW